jgi:hypothetical protein
MTDPDLGPSLTLLSQVVRSFGEAAGMPFLALDAEGAAAVRLESGVRFELEYVPVADRLLLHVELGAPLPTDLPAWSALLRENTSLMSAEGFSLGVGRIDGEDRLVMLASLPAAGLGADQLGETAVRLVEAARVVSDRLLQGGSPSSLPDTEGLETGFLRA